MAEPLWRKASCTSCNDERATVVIAHWGFDKDGTLTIYGVCRWCYRASTITHTFDEQRADIREMYNRWKETEESKDFFDWDRELEADDE